LRLLYLDITINSRYLCCHISWCGVLRTSYLYASNQTEESFKIRSSSISLPKWIARKYHLGPIDIFSLSIQINLGNCYGRNLSILILFRITVEQSHPISCHVFLRRKMNTVKITIVRCNCAVLPVVPIEQSHLTVIHIRLLFVTLQLVCLIYSVRVIVLICQWTCYTHVDLVPSEKSVIIIINHHGNNTSGCDYGG
jgi:hypothetical protein